MEKQILSSPVGLSQAQLSDLYFKPREGIIMLDFLLWNKIARIIKQLADTLHISTDRALQIFYDSDVCRMLHDKELGLHLMSDTYIVNDLIEELRNKQ